MVSVRKAICVAALLLLCLPLSAGRLDKAFEALGVHDYFKAKELFEKSLKSDEMLSNYGLSLIYSRDNNPFYQLDSAYSCIERSINAYDDVKAKDKKKIFEEQAVDKDTLYAQRQHIASLALDAAIKEHSVGALESVIRKYPFSSRQDEAITRRDELAFAQAEKQHTWSAYKTFADTYPNAPQAARARELYQKLLFEETTKGGTAEQYMAFVKAYPDSPYVGQAQEKIFDLTTAGKTLGEYTSFVRLYPDNPYTKKAWEAIYHLWFSDLSQERVDAFRGIYPQFPMKAILDEDVKLRDVKYFPILSKNKQYGFVNSQGQVTVEPQYDFVDDFSSRAALVGRGDKISYIDPRGTLLAGFLWEDGFPFKGELAVVMNNDRQGVINKAGGAVLPTDFDEVFLDEQGPVLARKGSSYRYYSREGRPLSNEYESAELFHDGLAVVRANGKAEIMSLDGQPFLSGDFSDIKILATNTLAIQDSTGKWTITDRTGAPLSAKRYDKVGNMADSLAAVQVGQKYGYIDPRGKEAIAVNLTAFDNIADAKFSQERAKTAYRNKYGMINTAGKRLLPNLFDDIIPSPNWPVPVQRSGLWGYADSKMNIIIKCIYDSAQPFSQGRAIVVRKGQWGVINEKGVILIPLEYSNIEPLGMNMYIVAKDGKMGIVNQEGGIVLPIEYDRLREYSPGILQVVMDGEFLYFDTNTGKFIYKGE